MDITTLVRHSCEQVLFLQDKRSQTLAGRDSAVSAKGNRGKEVSDAKSLNNLGRPHKHSQVKRRGSKSRATRSLEPGDKSANGRDEEDSGKKRWPGKGKATAVIDVSSADEDSDAASGYNDSTSSEEDTPVPASKRTPRGVSEAKIASAKKSNTKKGVTSAVKALSSKAAEKAATEADSDDEGQVQVMSPPDEDAYFCTKDGGGLEGPLNIALPGADSNSWTSNDFCLLVNNEWRRDRGE